MEIHPIKIDALGILEVRTYMVFVLTVNGELVAPNDAHCRYVKIAVTASDVVELHTDGIYQTKIKLLPTRGERLDPNSLCEVIDEQELSMFDRLRAEMQNLVSAYADDKQQDTWDEDNDLDFEEEDPLIDTPYEYKAMQEEFLEELPPQTTEIAEEKLKTEPPTASEQPASDIAE